MIKKVYEFHCDGNSWEGAPCGSFDNVEASTIKSAIAAARRVGWVLCNDGICLCPVCGRKHLLIRRSSFFRGMADKGEL